MIGLPSLAVLDRSTSTRIWLATAPADMRCGFDRLAELAQVVTNQNPMDGHLFLFRGRSWGPLKILSRTRRVRTKDKPFAWRHQLLPKHPMSEAVGYLLNQWTELNVFTTDQGRCRWTTTCVKGK